jgi:predicted Rossmann fold flavoprotein
MLLDECVTAGVDVRTGVTSGEISKGMGYSVETTGGTFQSATLVVATGGLSIPKLGASDLGYRIARQFGVNVIPPRPGLVPLTLRSEQAASKLSGVSLHVVARSGHRAFEDMMLFTHKGISGPAVLQASSYWSKQETVDIDLLPHGSVRDLLGVAGRKSVLNAFDRVWPRRFAEWWIEAELANRSCNALGRAELEELEMKAHRWSVHPAGTEGFAKAEVTVGGVDTRELSSKTMETRDVKGLYFIGEVVDVTGWLGGYNFQWAWASGFAAGQSC